MEKTARTLSAIWVFAALNYIYCDVVSLMDHEVLNQFLTGTVEGVEMSQGVLLAAVALLEIPIAMTLVSAVVTNHAVNRWANVVAGSVMTVVQIGSLFVGTPTAYYVFCSVAEIGATVAVVLIALRWRTPAQPAVH